MVGRLGQASALVGEVEIRITPAMIDAGLSALWGYEPDDSVEAVTAVFLAMCRAQHESQHRDREEALQSPR
jgi:hypothetical protein